MTYEKRVGRIVLVVETNDSGKNDSRVVLRYASTEHGSPMGRFTVEELRDLHYLTGRAIAAVELERSTSCSKS